MNEEFLGDRRKALEEAFFSKQNEELRLKLREKKESHDRKADLTAASGIADDEVLEKLIALGIHSETLVALSLVPLVQVAWADGKMEDKERSAILSAAEESGVGTGDVSHQVLEDWLRSSPGPEVLEAWKAYVTALAGALSPEAAASLKQDLLGRARRVAEAAGGLLGLRSISQEESAVLDELEKAFP